MSAPREATKALVAAGASQRLPATPGRPPPAALARRLTKRLTHELLPRIIWSASRTGRSGLAGLALLLAAATFFVSTHLELQAEVEALRGDLAVARGRPRPAAGDKGPGARPAAVLGALPPRSELPAILRQLFAKAAQARLAVDTGKYELHGAGTSGVVRFQVSFPVTGPYQQIRTFIDSALATVPALALTELTLDRKLISDPSVEAQIRMTIYAAAPAAPVQKPAQVALAQAEPDPSKTGPEPGRVVEPTRAASLFAARSWYVVPPAPLPPPPVEPPPPPAPTAPPFPYAVVGSYSPEGRPQVFFLSKGDKMIDALVGDQLDGVYRFESAAGGQLTFVYLPLNTRQSIPMGAP